MKPNVGQICTGIVLLAGFFALVTSPGWLVGRYRINKRPNANLYVSPALEHMVTGGPIRRWGLWVLACCITVFIPAVWHASGLPVMIVTAAWAQYMAYTIGCAVRDTKLQRPVSYASVPQDQVSSHRPRQPPPTAAAVVLSVGHSPQDPPTTTQDPTTEELPGPLVNPGDVPTLPVPVVSPEATRVIYNETHGENY